ncbi:FAD-dependent oxidoreductase [Streptomyces luteolus]|uniref:FAD-dependent oxidoreductase n=1 Tax=Streptomyces luteolus TaxID=3043615 RepID=A0ABT6SW70_9ACTN|nr:FAD-dependent oxidoreductase [Streptomyces sp. B-S-A12]MDI3419094.1 FAD-dependent oxidoreductase [Streptomyces sp. B-S-A12]
MTEHWDHTYDVVVVGSGAAGMAAAITARLRGLTALVVEKTDRYGGSTALSGGGVWIPDNLHHEAAGLGDTPEQGRAYLDATVGDRVPAERKDAFLAHGPAMLREFHDRTDVRFCYVPDYSDYYPERPGGFPQGRSIEPEMFDLKRLTPEQRAGMRRAGLPTYGLTITTRDFRHLNMVGRTWKGRRTSLKVGARAVKNLATGRKMLSLGEALVARMRHSLDRHGADLWLSVPVTGLVTEGQRITGVRVERAGREIAVRATGGVVLASGGFSHSPELREKFLPSPTSTEWTAAAEGQTGDGLELALAAGAATDLMDKVWGGPMVVAPGAKPFFLVADRGIPGMVIVNQAGERYTNEACPYHAFVDAMYANDRPDASTVPSWMILDAAAKSRYMITGLFPGQPFPKQWTESGFVKKADTLDELAVRTGLPATRLRATVDRFNAFARAGRDEDFHRGDSAYDRYYGDPTLTNPNLAPVTKGPFYAVPLQPGDIGTKGGAVTDARARVLREDGTPIEGLYASGNVAAAVMGETYPGPGATIGPAMTFSWIAVNHIAGRDQSTRTA